LLVTLYDGVMKNSERFVQRKAYGYISLYQLCLVAQDSLPSRLYVVDLLNLFYRYFFFACSLLFEARALNVNERSGIQLLKIKQITSKFALLLMRQTNSFVHVRFAFAYFLFCFFLSFLLQTVVHIFIRHYRLACRFFSLLCPI
jgi:hypothetical protein